MRLIKKQPQKNNFRNEQPQLIPNQGKVTTITPSYNRFDSLLTMIRSIKEQTYKNIEIIVVNDGSTDPRYDSLPEYGVKHIKIEHTGLHMVAMNRGIEQSNGKYIAFIDDDDIWFPTKIERQMQYLRQSSCKMCSTNARVGSDFWSYGKDISTHNYFREQLPNIFTEQVLKNTNYCMNSSVIIEKSLLYKTGLFNEHKLFRHQADWDLWKRIIKHTNCVYISDPLIYYRDNRTASSMRYGHGGSGCDEINAEITKLEQETGKKFPDCIDSFPPKL